MQLYHTTQTWGYKILSPYHISFYHILLPQISADILLKHIPQGIEHIEKQHDGSILIHVSAQGETEEVVKQLVAFFNQTSHNFLDTPAYYYKIPTRTRQSFLSWGLAFQGCLALLLQFDQQTKQYVTHQWEYLNSQTGGIYMDPFTLLLYEDYPKIVHPITLQNITARNLMEQTTALLIRKMIRRIDEAQQGLEGLALLSFVEEKTELSQAAITKTINDKSFQVKAPIHSPFFMKLSFS